MIDMGTSVYIFFSVVAHASLQEEDQGIDDEIYDIPPGDIVRTRQLCMSIHMYVCIPN